MIFSILHTRTEKGEIKCIMCNNYTTRVKNVCASWYMHTRFRFENTMLCYKLQLKLLIADATEKHLIFRLPHKSAARFPIILNVLPNFVCWLKRLCPHYPLTDCSPWRSNDKTYWPVYCDCEEKNRKVGSLYLVESVHSGKTETHGTSLTLFVDSGSGLEAPPILWHWSNYFSQHHATISSSHLWEYMLFKFTEN